MIILFFVVLIFGVFVILCCRAAARRRFMKGRYPRTLLDIHKEVHDQVSFDVLSDVWSRIGEAFSIDPKIINPDDKMKTLDDIDSWDLGKGSDALNRWIEQEQFGIPPAFVTVLDFAKWIQSCRMSRK
ncbi:hypothetical protein [Xanthomonas axonopodis]|uniref:hypothetical protein n=2 Tax=Xanthomonas axonopodis TaxID=53413 RepID=UPI0010708029|nr:hypothetical protein [Xanthomonas axonopodis]QKD85437.1 hypothetical protein XAV_01910 [Xanthomonas axonopodis pv. vasculorum]